VNIEYPIVAPREDKYIITGWWSYDEPGEA
jgi:hypothetical protein